MSTRPASMEPVIFTPQTVYCGDCLDILKHFPSETVDLIYIDPPFNSNRNYEVFWDDHQERRAFNDRFGDAKAYIDYMRPRVYELYRVLKPTGSFYYHCDWHASHYIKILLDELFGANYFVNEIIWKRYSAHGNVFNKFGVVHDTIFMYRRGKDFTWNQQYGEYNPDYLDTFFKHVEEGTGRRFRTQNVKNPSDNRPNLKYEWNGHVRTWKWTKERLQQLHDDDRLYYSKTGYPQLKQYLDEMPGPKLQSLWDDVPSLSTKNAESLGYPTQKPLALLERIIKASSNEGDLVLDGFCGCGTTLVAAQQLGRKFVGIDISPTSSRVMGERLELVCGMKALPVTGDPHILRTKKGKGKFRYSNLPRTREQLRALPGFEFENWAVLELGEVLQHQGIGAFAQTNRAKVGDMGLDGKLYLVDKVSLLQKGKETLFGEKQPYLPIQVKNKDKAGRPDMDSFAHALRRDKRRVGFFISWEFTKDAHKEIDRLMRLPHGGDENPVHIIPVRVDELLTESFKMELLLWQGG